MKRRLGPDRAAIGDAGAPGRGETGDDGLAVGTGGEGADEGAGEGEDVVPQRAVAARADTRPWRTPPLAALPRAPCAGVDGMRPSCDVRHLGGIVADIACPLQAER
ncbi:hypothetical protein GCM10009549_15300 [Streptomyces thermoalcalitolerans]|uniref:Uncharacterized protein n=1 Tax=Streptomyces thermoalcalitolerans TaxID=65605 RepID=A0ABP3YWL5_9ACTN